ncbi:MAG: hypothetical protein AB7L09_00990 [Nitrospira sp.]
MKAKRVICVVKGHVWVLGRVAGRVDRELVPGLKSYHNRACSRCDLEEWNADEVEAEAERIRLLKERMGFSKDQSELEPIDQSVDPNEFP